MADYDLMTGVKKAYEAYSPANKPTAADVTDLDEALNTKLDKASVVAPMANGGVIERGSNANGEFIKFADGTMICTCLYTHTVSSNGIHTKNYPADFSTPPAFTALARGITSSGTNGAYVVESSAASLSSVDVKLLVVSSTGLIYPSSSIGMSYTAIGRWK